MHEERDDTPVRDVSRAKEDGRKLSSQLFEMMRLKNAKTTEPGPHAALCDEKDPDHYYAIRHAWATYGVTFKELQEAMERIKRDMPEKGWKVVKYGPDTSPAKTLELIADSTEKEFSVAIHLLDERKKQRDSRLTVNLVSKCYETPKGKTVSAP